MRRKVTHAAGVFLVLAALGQVSAQQKYDLLLKGGHVVDPRNRISAVRDVAIANGKVAAVAARIDPAEALKVVDVSGLYVTPGLVDIHVHVYAGTGERGSYAGDNSVYPDGFTLRSGVTTVADAGCAGWRNFEDFKQRIIDRARTRVLALLNIVGHGMRGGKFEQDLADMEAAPTAEMALRHKGLIVGIKTAHYAGPEWTPVERAVEAGTIAKIPVMVDFGVNRPERPLSELVTRKLRPGDIYTHVYSGLRNEQDESGRVNPALWEARKRGVIFDVGHGGGSFLWRVAVPAVKAGFLPDSISTDLHIGSMNAGMKDMLNVMDKFLAMGLSLDDVMLRSTWNPAKEIGHEELGHLSPGAIADIGVFRLEKGSFGFVDMYGARLKGTQKLACELTLREGKVVYDLNGIARPDWDTLPRDYKQTGDARWDAVTPAPAASPRTASAPMTEWVRIGGGDPMLSPQGDGFESAGVFNPAVIRRGRDYVMIYRAQDRGGVSRLGYATSRDGLSFTRRADPILVPDADYERRGVEDPRLVEIAGQYWLTYTAYDGTDAQLALASSSDLEHWQRHGVILPANRGRWNIHWTKSGAILPTRINGKYWMYYMADAATGADQLGVAESADLLHWTESLDAPLLARRPGFFDARVVEPGPPPILTDEGILLIYNGADERLVYSTGWALFDRRDPTKLIARSDRPIFQAERPWEKIGQVPNVVFVEGLVQDGARWLMYYGAADKYIGVAATGPVSARR